MTADVDVWAWGRALRRPVLFLLVGLVFFTGCLPYSCRREPNETLFAADSLSRRVAAEVPADTLTRVGTSVGTTDHPLSYPRTVRFAETDVVVSDAKRNSVFRFGPDGAFRREVADTTFSVPYLIGHRRDTLVVFNAGTDRIDLVVDGQRRADRAVSYERPTRGALVYMLATDTSFYAKVVGEDVGAHVSRLDASGRVVAQAELGGPYWRHAGFLRSWDGAVASLSGYRPVVHRLSSTFADGATADSLSLVGFDSPMLERSYAYAAGDVDKPPLLTVSSAAVGDTLFVLNLRPGWTQIDAYGPDGRLQRRLVERHSGGNRGFYPVDLDARRTDTGYRFAVAVRSPEPRLELFRWAPGS